MRKLEVRLTKDGGRDWLLRVYRVLKLRIVMPGSAPRLLWASGIVSKPTRIETPRAFGENRSCHRTPRKSITL